MLRLKLSDSTPTVENKEPRGFSESKREANFSSVSSAVIPTKERFFSFTSRDILVPNLLPSHLLSKKEKLKYWPQNIIFPVVFMVMKVGVLHLTSWKNVS